MEKIVRFLRDSRLMRILIVSFGLLIVGCFIFYQNLFAIWLICVWQIFVYIPIAYELSAQFNFTSCSDFHSRLKKIKVNSSCKKAFCGDIHGYIVWPTFLYQCILLIYILTSVLLSLIFITIVLITNVNQVIWEKIWFFEIIALDVILAIVLLSKTIYSIYFSLKERKNHSSNICNVRDMINNDKKMLKNKKIIKKVSKIIIFLKQYGLYFDEKRKCYKISYTEVTHVERTLLKEFPKLNIIISESQYGMQHIKIYSAKNKYLLLQIEINHK